MEIDIKHACSFTGHRPERLEMSEDKVIAWLEEQIRKAVADGYTDFITGMQRGVDIWAGEIVVKLYNHGKFHRMIKNGQKISQLVILPCLYEDVEIVDEIDGGPRGDNGFGSTGV